MSRIFYLPKSEDLKYPILYQGWTSSMGYMNAANNLILRASIAAKEVKVIFAFLFN
jgi:hypothetical protein